MTRDEMIHCAAAYLTQEAGLYYYNSKIFLDGRVEVEASSYFGAKRNIYKGKVYRGALRIHHKSRAVEYYPSKSRVKNEIILSFDY